MFAKRIRGRLRAWPISTNAQHTAEASGSAVRGKVIANEQHLPLPLNVHTVVAAVSVVVAVVLVHADFLLSSHATRAVAVLFSDADVFAGVAVVSAGLRRALLLVPVVPCYEQTPISHRARELEDAGVANLRPVSCAVIRSSTLTSVSAVACWFLYADGKTVPLVSALLPPVMHGICIVLTTERDRDSRVKIQVADLRMT